MADPRRFPTSSAPATRARRFLRAGWVAGLVLAAVASPDAGHAAQADQTLNVALDAEIATLDYYMGSGRNGIIMAHHLYDTLLYKDVKTGKIIPALAASYTFTDDTTIEFELRKGVKFHDGSEMTADDVVYTLNTVSNPDYGAVYQIAVKWIDRAEKLGDYKVRLKMREPYPVALEWLAGFLPIYPKGYYEKAGKQGMAVKPVGTGPYKLVSVQPGTRWRLERFQDHYQGSPKGNAIKFIEMRVLPEINTQLTELITGKLDFIWKFSPDVAKRLKGRDGIVVKNAPILRIVYAAMNTVKDSPLKDVRVRRALIHAIDRARIMQSFVGGESQVIHSACNPVQFGCTADVKAYAFDPKKAKQLLQEAGFADGFKAKILISKSGAVPRTVVEAILADLARVGVKADIEYQQWAAARKKWIANDGHMMLMSWGSWGIGDVAMMTSEWFSEGDVNRVRDADVIDWLNTADSSPDRGKREQHYRKALEKIADQAYWLPLWTFNANYALSDDVEFTLDADEIARFFNATWKN